MSLAGNKDPWCYVCGLDNPVGLRVRFAPYGALGSRACYTACAVHAGWDGILHGGVIFALMDEALRWSLYFQNIVAATARVETRFHPPIPVGTSLIVTARVIKQRRRLFEAARRDLGRRLSEHPPGGSCRSHVCKLARHAWNPKPKRRKHWS